jgi:superfamily II DNA/RNA helicase
MGLTVAAVFGGTPQRPQVAALRNRADIVVACPGRLADLIGQGHCHLGDVEVVVLDEADQMADLGFLPVVRQLLEATPPEGQRLLFSATLDGEVDVLRSIADLPARRTAPVARLARPAAAATQATGSGAVAASGGYRGRRRPARRG